jgi:hypothetical protein
MNLFHSSPLDVAARSFELLTEGPRPPVLPNGISADRLPVLVPTLDREGRDAIWRQLVGLARDGDPAWTVICTGLALPGLRTAAAAVARGLPDQAADMDAEILTGFLVALREVDARIPDVCGRLREAAYNAGRRARYAELAHRNRRADDDTPVPAFSEPAHPDAILARAVADGVVSALEAELIGRVHLEGRSIRIVAAELWMARTTAQDTLKKAVVRLASWLDANNPRG